MLKTILISRVRIRILETYFLNPGVKYHVRGIVRELNEEINAVRRELLNLEATGILKSKKDGNKIVYQLDPDCTVIPELKSLLIKDSKTGKKIIERVKEIEDLDAVILTDNFLTQTYPSEKDIDMLFLGNAKIKDIKLAITQLESDLDRELRATAMKREDFDFAKKKKDEVVMNLLKQNATLIYGTPTSLL